MTTAAAIKPVVSQNVTNWPTPSQHFVSRVVFETFDTKAGVSVEVAVHWTEAIKYLHSHEYRILTVLWADRHGSEEHGYRHDLHGYGNQGRSFAKWLYYPETDTYRIFSNSGTLLLSETETK